MIEFDDLQRGRMYLVAVRYWASGQLYEREFRALFGGEGDYGELVFHLRPLAGFLAVPKPWVTNIEEARNKPPFLPRIPET